MIEHRMKTKILMVCLGNICRSPLAEGIMRSKLDEDRFLVDSAGTGSWHIGKAPDRRSVAVARKHGIDIAGQRARQFSMADFEAFDHIYAMDGSNYDDLIALAPNALAKGKVKMIANEAFDGQNIDVPDPYYGTEKDFEKVYSLLDQICTEIASKMT